MNNLKKRCLTLLLSLAMIVTYMPTSLIAYAEAEGETDQVQVEQQVDAEEPAAEVTSEDAAPEEVKTEDVKSEEAASDEKTEDAALPEKESSEEAGKPTDEKTKEDADAKAEDDAKDEFSEGNLTAEEGPYEVTVSYSEKAKIPEGAKLKLTVFDENDKEFTEAKEALVSDKEGNSAFSQTTEEEQKDLGMAAFDLTIVDKDGKEIEPEDEVAVSFKLKELPEGVDAETLAASMEIQHLNESSGNVVVEKIATVDSYEAERKDDVGEITISEGKESAEAETIVDAFSTFTITWRNGSNRTATIHYGYMNNGSFVEFASNPTYTTTNENYPDYLIRDFEGYKYSGYTYYRNNQSSTPASGGTRIQAMLRHTNNEWRYHNYSDDYSTNNWNALANNSHVYVVYEAQPAITTGGHAVAHITDDTVHPNEPDVLKESKDNDDGTRELALSITGHTAKLEAEKLADVIVVFDNSGSMRYNMAGGTTSQDANRRLTIAKTAVNNLARTLLSKTNSSGGKLIRMSLISFNTTAEVSQGFTDNYGTFSSAVNGITADGGTNWEQALQLANQMAVDSERTTFVIFVSDGDPTFRVSRMNANDANLASNTSYDVNNEYYISDNVYGTGSSDNSSRNYNAALAEAKSIVQHNKKLYTIGISNDVSNMAKLNSEAGGNGNYTATSASELETAFNQIISEIEGTLGYGANVNDGITGLTNLTAKAPIVGVDEESFKYYRNGVEWDPEEAGASKAHYNAETGAVEWDLGTNFQLENDVTYKVTFTVWPSQQAIDYVTQLNNNEIEFDDLPADVQKQISESPAGSGNYVLETNTEDANVSYQESTKVGNTVTPIGEVKSKEFQKVEPLKLDTMDLSVEKIFTDILTGGEDRDTEVTLFLQRRVVNGDGTFGEWEDFAVPYIKPDGSTAHSNQIVLSEANQWKAHFYISPGLETVHEGVTVVYNPGYEFRVTEPNVDYHYELNGEIIKPMLVNFVKTYIGDTDNSQSLTADNIVKSGIDVKKTALDKDGNVINPDVDFTINGKILDKDGNPFTFDMSWDDRTDKSTGDGASATWQQHQNDPIAYHKYDKDGNRIGYKLHVASTGNISIPLKAGESVRFINVPQGCTFEFSESNVDGFALDDLTAITQHREVVDGPFIIDPEELQPTVSNGVASLSSGVVGDKQYSIEFKNKVTKTTKATVTKEFTGITKDLLTDTFKAGYSITANYNGEDHTLKLTDAGVEASTDGLTFTWTIENLVIGDTVKVTESGYDKTEAGADVIPGYEFQLDKSTTSDETDSLVAVGEDDVVPDSNQAKLVNDYLQIKTSKTVVKKWDENVDRDLLGITSVTVILRAIADGVITETSQELSDLNNWTHTFSDLPVYAASGAKITYEIVEVAVNGKIDNVDANLINLFDVDTKVDGDTTTITNKYDATPVEVSFPVKKIMKVPSGATGPNWSYTIDVTAQGRAPEAETMSGTVTKAEPVTTFGPFTYDVPGTYTYKVTETGTYPNVTNDSAATTGKTVTVSVVADENGKLTATADSTENDPLTFTNEYKVDKTSLPLEAKKILTGRTLKAGEFSFELKDAEGTVLQTKPNDVDGKVAFDAIEYTLPGTYTYTITEVKGSLAGVTYDTTEHTAVVTVIDNGNGTMTASVLYDEKEAIPEFKNTYNAEGSAKLEVTKVLTGRDLEEGQFSFELKDKDGKVLQTKTNTADGKVSFDAIKYDQDDAGKTFTYTITEVIPANAVDNVKDGYTYDPLVVTATVTVTDDGSGKLTTSIKYSEDTEFNNSYAAEGSAKPEVTKVLTGRKLEEGQFSFELKDKDGKVLQTKTNTADGKVSFDAIKYDQGDAGKTFTYTITEVNAGAAGYTYDDHTVKVTVTVTDKGNGSLTDKGNGSLETKVDYDGATEFKNTYAAEGSAKPEVTKVLTGRDLEEGQFSFELKDKDGKVLQTKTNTADGKVSFDAIPYTQASVDPATHTGTFTYTITEVNAGAAGYT